MRIFHHGDAERTESGNQREQWRSWSSLLTLRPPSDLIFFLIRVSSVFIRG